ncbi:cerebellin-2-like [Saccostrea cucullata]|uniref:cerebellin-2-like n=1 Tax=Saccostrea cuccullata TaxID=36930 RepID=UPI002ED11B62
MNDTKGLQRSLLWMQHEEIQTSKEISEIIRNVTAIQDLHVVGPSDAVAFSATITSEITSSSGQTLVFPHVLCNVGGGYNNKNGIFTAPVDGTYVFFVRITPSSNPTDMYFSIVLNGIEEAKHLVYGRDSIPFRISTNTIALQLNHSDRVWVKINTGGRMWSSGTHSGDQTFTGYKV